MSIQSRSLLFSGAVGGLLLACGLIALIWSAGQCRTQHAELKQIIKLHTQLIERNPFPSEENLQQLNENLDVLEFHVGELSAALAQEGSVSGSRDAAGFSARAQQVIEQIRLVAEREGVKLPRSLEAGFDKYVSGGVLPRVEDVARLSRQLYAVDRVAAVLLQSGVQSVESILRDPFEEKRAGVRSGSSARRRGGPPPERMATASASVEHPGGDYSAERIRVVFTAAERQVWAVLDALASAPDFMVVREFSHETQTDILNYKPDVARRSAEKEGSPVLTRPERMLAGRETVRVSLVVDVLRFSKIDQGEAAAW